MKLKKVLTAAAAVAILSVAGASAASAHGWYGHGYQDDRDTGRYGYEHRDGDRFDRDHRRFADRRMVFETLRFHHIRYWGEPHFVRGHYVIRTFDRFGRVSFVEINPYTGGLVGYIRL